MCWTASQTNIYFCNNKLCWMTNQFQFELSDIEINKGKIVVLGGGLAGLTTAILIARAGMCDHSREINRSRRPSKNIDT
jgi:heterodisulfide reductase subunit A-like polyferredoxin